MQKGEYLFVILGENRDGWKPFVINGEEVKDWRKGSTTDVFSNKMGEEGWELITYVPIVWATINGIRLVFKRHKT